MPSIGNVIYYSAVVAWSAAIYQYLIKDILTVSLGLGRVIQTIDEFPYSCKRIEHPQLEACEDLWLDEQDRVLYAACTGTKSRMAWNPSVSKLNASGRRTTGSELIALDIDSITPDGSFTHRTIKPTGNFGALNNGILDTLGFTGVSIDTSTIHFHLINLAPYAGTYFTAASLGANASIETFSHTRGTTSMTHLSTLHSTSIYSPNRPAALTRKTLLITNDHSAKLGWRKSLDPLIGGGSVTHCTLPTGPCHTATPPPGPNIATNLKFPNGLAIGEDGLIYVPSSADGTIRVYAVQADASLALLHTVRVGMPLDNVSPDAAGDLWVPGFPDARQMFKALEDPYRFGSPATVFRVRRVGGDETPDEFSYEVTKIIEDKHGSVISGATTVVHDVKSGRLFIGAAVSPFLVVCEPS